MNSSPALIIFDCDGVLVDSEELGTRTLVDFAREFGPLPMDLPEAMQLFRGRKMAECVDVLCQRLGRPLPENFIPSVRARTADAFRRSLRPIPGIHDALRSLSIPICVASNGPREKITLALSVTGLLPFFEGRIFSSYEIGSWKPEPGLFLHTAQSMNVKAENCAVVEDSVLGVRAGLAACMRVLAYTAGSNSPEFHLPGVTRFERMADLPRLVN